MVSETENVAPGNIFVVPGPGSQLQFSCDGGATWIKVSNQGDYNAAGGEPPTAEAATKEGVGIVVGHSRIPSIAVSIPALQPHRNYWKQLQKADRQRTLLLFRYTTKGGALEGGAADKMVAIAKDTGLATFSGDGIKKGYLLSGLFAEGHSLEVGGKTYVIDRIPGKAEADAETGKTAIVLPAPAAAVAAAANFKINEPFLQQTQFAGRVSGTSAFEHPAEGALTGSFTIQPLSNLGISEWEIVDELPAAR